MMSCSNCTKSKVKKEDCAKQHSIHDPKKQACIAWKGDKKQHSHFRVNGRNRKYGH